jgi:hypothetical protein
MPATIVSVLSLAAFVYFLVGYCRALVIAYAKVELSPNARTAAGLGGRELRGEDFPALLLRIRLCRTAGDDRWELLAVRGYFKLVNLLTHLLHSYAPTIQAWSERERCACAHFAAVAFDRRLGSADEVSAT